MTALLLLADLLSFEAPSEHYCDVRLGLHPTARPFPSCASSLRGHVLHKCPTPRFLEATIAVGHGVSSMFR